VTKSIDIDIEVYRVIEAGRISFEESQNKILRRILGIDGHSISQGFDPWKKQGSGSRPADLDYLSQRSIDVTDFSFGHSGVKEPDFQEDRKDSGIKFKDFQSPFYGMVIPKTAYGTKDWLFGGVRLPEGTRLQKWYGGTKYEAEIRNGSILFEGVSYQSPSAAAMVITGGSNVSGWNFWKFFDPHDGEWKKLITLKGVTRED
jgi:hypothetical protein